MRVLFGISTVIALAIVITLIVFWTNVPTQAKQQLDAVSMDPLAMTGTVTNLPQAHYKDYSTIY